jgi:DNA repair exonuclease SbcCD ATPase subunit
MAPVLNRIKETVLSHVPVVDTAAGRQDIRSLAFKIAQSKTALDAAGKDLVAGWKAKAKKVDEARKEARDFLDALKAEVRQPLTDFEEAEKAREAAEALEREIAVAWNDAHREHELYLQRKDQEAREAEIAKKEAELAQKEAAARAAEERRIREEEIARVAAERAKPICSARALSEIPAFFADSSSL